MIVIDTSALMAILLGEATGEACIDCLAEAEALCMSAGTLAECLIVSDKRGIRAEMERLLDGLGVEVVAVTAAEAVRVADAYQRWGKGNHAAGLNYGDCFAYALAKEVKGDILYVGDDFTRTDAGLALSHDS
jgi:ribonuclease VapC